MEMNRRVVIFPAPFQGHVTPMMHLANLLDHKGFAITVIQTTYNPLNPTHFPNLTFYSLDDGLHEAYLKSPPPDSFKVLSDLNSACIEPFRVCISQILNDQDPVPVTCLIADPIFVFLNNVARSFNLPRIALRTGSLSSFIVYDSLSSLREKGYFPLQESRLNEVLVELAPLKVKDLPVETHHDLLTTMLNETKTSQGMICNTFEELEPDSLATLQQTLLSVPIFPIGPLHKYFPDSQVSIWTQDQTSIAWLDSKAPNSVLYVSFGSVAAISEAEFLEVAWGLADSQQHFLWVVRSGMIQGSDDTDSYTLLPEGYEEIVKERGHIVKWAPQAEVLCHPSVGGFWTHSGWNSTLESISEGVPMICLPFFGDQSINARYVSDKWRVGLQVEKGVKREDVTMAIRRLMVDDEGKEMRNRIGVLKEKSDVCLMGGHSSNKHLDRLINYLLAM